ncbi:MAG: hypothetical protein KF891_04020 [Rhizobacter sp.]|nr:hypothetical protein [Rhizobacter sp.]
MPLATLSIDLEARLAKLEEGLTKAGRMSEKAANQIEQNLARNRKVAEDLGKAIGAAFSAEALRRFFVTTVDGLDALNDLKDATGASIENISALEDVADRTGTSFESMASTLIKFNKVLSDSKAGGDVAEILKRLGLSAEELKKIDPAEALRQTAVALAGVADDGARARAIQILFGKSVAEAAPFLKDLADSGQLNAKVTAEQAQAAEDFNKALDNLAKNTKDAARSFVSDLIPALNQLFDVMKGGAGGGSSVISEFITVPLQATSVLAANVAFVLKGIGREIGGIGAQAAAVAQLEFGRAGAIGDAMRADAKAAREEFDKLEQRLMSVGRVLPTASYSNEGRMGPLKSIGDLPDTQAKKKISELDKYIDQLEKATLASLDLSKEDEARIEIASGKLGQLTQAQKDYVIELAHGIDVMKETQKVFRDTSSIEDAISLQRELSNLIDATPLSKMEKTMELEQALTEAFKNGTNGFDGSSEAAQRFEEALAALHPELKQFTADSSEFAKQGAANIQDAFGETLTRTFKGDFDKIEQLWGDMLLNMAAQAAAAKLTELIFGSGFGSAGGGFGGIVGGVVGAIFGGGGSSGPTIGGGSAGGYVMPTMGPASTGGRTMAAQRTVVIDNSGQTINIGANVSRAEVLNAIDQKTAQTEERIRRSLRQGTYT